MERSERAKKINVLILLLLEQPLRQIVNVTDVLNQGVLILLLLEQPLRLHPSVWVR